MMVMLKNANEEKTGGTIEKLKKVIEKKTAVGTLNP
jgi:hypothetical protein